MEVKTSDPMMQFMSNEGLVISRQEESKRRYAILKLKKIVMNWASTVARLRKFSHGFVMAACATIRVFGSYGLGVHNSHSDIDALCVVPYFISSEDFFGLLRNMLASTPGVSDILCIKNAKVPQIKFSFDGVKFDLPYARLNAPSIHEAVDVLNPFLLQDIDETSRRSMSGVVTNKKILQLFPNIEPYQAYQSLLRCAKFWAKRRGVYGYALGYLGGVHFAVLAAFICRRHPNAPLSVLVLDFFCTYAFWPWPAPVILEDDNMPPNDTPMPIQLCGTNQYCDSNITKSTFNGIMTEFQRAHELTKDFLVRDFDWRPLFEVVSYGKNYESFLEICVSSRHRNELGDWVGWVKSRMRQLLSKLDELPGFCYPDPTAYYDGDLLEPNKVFYWGLDANKSNSINVESIKNDFMSILMRRHGPTRTMELSVVNASKFAEAKANNRSTSMIATKTRRTWQNYRR